MRLKLPAFSRRFLFFLCASRRRKILSSILAVLIVITSVRFVFFRPEEASAAWPPARMGLWPGGFNDSLLMFLGTFYVYALKSKKDNKYYIGQTNNLKRRLKQHNSGQVRSTKPRIPFKLIGYKKFQTRSEARWFEHEVKSHGDKKMTFLTELKQKHDKES